MAEDADTHSYLKSTQAEDAITAHRVRIWRYRDARQELRQLFSQGEPDDWLVEVPDQVFGEDFETMLDSWRETCDKVIVVRQGMNRVVLVSDPACGATLLTLASSDTSKAGLETK